jgi:hypothetical protein
LNGLSIVGNSIAHSTEVHHIDSKG